MGSKEAKKNQSTGQSKPDILEKDVSTGKKSKDEEFQLLNALEIFWNINSDNIELLKQNWGWKCAIWVDDTESSPSADIENSVDFHIYETKRNIQGDVLTIKPEFLDNILSICKTINPFFISESEVNLPLFWNAENLYKHTLSMLKVIKVQKWQEFELQLTKVIEYKVIVMYYAVS